MNKPMMLKACLPSALLLLSSCTSMDAIKKGDVIGGLIGAPFEIASGAIDTATMPLSRQKPQWIRDAEISNMRNDRPMINDPAWCRKFEKELAAGSIDMATFEENLKAYKITKNEKYLGRAEQLAAGPEQQGQLEEAVLQALGEKAFDVRISVNGSSTKARYDEHSERILFFSPVMRGAKLHPRGHATVTLRNDLPMKLRHGYKATLKFKFIIPRKMTTRALGMVSTNESNSVSTVTQTLDFHPGSRTRSVSLDFGQMNGATTVSMYGALSEFQLSDPPHATYELVSVSKL